MGWLAGHVANMTLWTYMTFDRNELDVNPQPSICA